MGPAQPNLERDRTMFPGDETASDILTQLGSTEHAEKAPLAADQIGDQYGVAVGRHVLAKLAVFQKPQEVMPEVGRWAGIVDGYEEKPESAPTSDGSEIDPNRQDAQLWGKAVSLRQTTLESLRSLLGGSEDARRAGRYRKVVDRAVANAVDADAFQLMAVRIQIAMAISAAKNAVTKLRGERYDATVQSALEGCWYAGHRGIEEQVAAFGVLATPAAYGHPASATQIEAQQLKLEAAHRRLEAATKALATELKQRMPDAWARVCQTFRVRAPSITIVE